MNCNVKLCDALPASGAALFSLAAAVLLCGAPCAEASLAAAQVKIGGYCCTTPTAPDLFTNELTGTVPVDFPVGELVSKNSLGVIPVGFSVSANRITQSYPSFAIAAGGSFNGVVYDFTGSFPAITNVTVDPLSTVTPTSIAFTGNSIHVNGAGVVVSAGSKIILDVTTTPAPAALALFGTALAGLVVVRRRQTPRQAP